MKVEQSWTVARLLDWTSKFLQEKGCESSRLDSEVLLAHALGATRIALYTRHDEEVTEKHRGRFKELIQERVKGCPVAYLVGRKEFFSLTLEVTPDVLIPRPDTETVVDTCLQLAKEMAVPAVLDVGTGSGCIALAVAKYCKQAVVTATDISPAALAIAGRNSSKHDLAQRIRLLPGDLFAALPAGERFDFVLSNPPYIPHDDIASLEPGVRDREPHLALDGGVDGFAVFDRLVREAPSWLRPGGYLIVEIGTQQEGPARAKLDAMGVYVLNKTIFDSAGHPRVLLARHRPNP